MRFASSCRPKPAPSATSPPASTVSPRCRREGSVLVRRLVYVALYIEIGLLLLVLPWSAFWERNYFVYAWPAIRPVITNHFLRGAISGLGVINLVAGFSELAPVFTVDSAAGAPVGDRADT